jgi:hypothetical protein
MKKSLTLKEMVNTYVNEAGVKEREKVWTTFWNMKCLGFIEGETWNKFYDKCKSVDSDVTDMEPFRF